MQLTFISTDSLAYETVRKWRYRLFFAPHGLPPAVISPAAEKAAWHLVAWDKSGQKAVGYGQLLPQANGCGLVRQVLVLPAWQRHGIGRAIVAKLIDKGVELGLNRLRLAARAQAAGFYERLGFVVTGASFASPTTAVPHLPMQRHLALTIPTPFSTEMLTQVQAVYPQEGCGILAGDANGRLRHHYPVDNQLASPVAYEMDAHQQIRAMLDIEANGWELLAIYHSHPHSPAIPSPTDVAHAYYPDTIQLIISLADRQQPLTKGYIIVAKQIFPIFTTVEQP